MFFAYDKTLLTKNNTSGVIVGYYKGLNTIAVGLLLGKIGAIKMSHIFEYLSIKNQKNW